MSKVHSYETIEMLVKRTASATKKYGRNLETYAGIGKVEFVYLRESKRYRIYAEPTHQQLFTGPLSELIAFIYNQFPEQAA